MKTFDASVNGLRAIAIIAVIAFHYGAEIASGGFIGVDIFFVISGYVITLSILEKQNTNTFSLWSYFKSRFFRIFPALLVMSFLTLLFSSFILFPADAELAAKHALSSITFVSNFVFWKEVGYFDTSNAFKPFLHTWSLSVEWQFYLLWPMALYVLYVFKKYAIALLSMAILAGISASGLLANYSNFTFYMMPFRGWEFALGALIAFIPSNIKLRQKFAAPSTFLGFGGVLLSVILFNEGTIFPGYAAALPCLSTFILLFFSRAYTTPILPFKPFQYLGNLSYSLYLYHWPVFILYAQFVFRDLLWIDYIVILLTVWIMSDLSYRLIETPFRSKQKPVLKISILIPITALCTIAAFYIFQTDGNFNRYTKEQRELLTTFKTENEAYQKRYGAYYPKSPDEIWVKEKHFGIPCSYDDYNIQTDDDDKLIKCIANNHANASKQKRYLIIGDSNGKNTFEALKKAFPNQNFSMLMHSGCAPAETKQCFPLLTKQLPSIITDAAIDGVILSSRFSYQSIDGIENTISLLDKQGVPFMVISATPTLRKPIDMIMIKKGLSLHTGQFIWPLDRAYFHNDILKKDAVLQKLSENYNGTFFDKRSFICPGNQCIMKLRPDKMPIYLDTQHLSANGLELYSNTLQHNEHVQSFMN